MSFVLLQAETAFARGPWGGGGNGIAVGGTYAGAFFPSTNNNSLGVFSLAIPSGSTGTGGLSTGDSFYFTQGYTFQGMIIGVANPTNGTLNANMTLALYSEQQSGPNGAYQLTIAAFAGGLVKGEISNPSKGSAGVQTVSGTVTMIIPANPTPPIVTATTEVCTIVGFQQTGTQVKTTNHSDYPLGGTGLGN